MLSDEEVLELLKERSSKTGFLAAALEGTAIFQDELRELFYFFDSPGKFSYFWTPK